MRLLEPPRIVGNSFRPSTCGDCGWAYDEEAVRRFVEILDGCGRRAEALRVYEAFAARLEGDLGVAPAPLTRTLIQTVRAR